MYRLCLIFLIFFLPGIAQADIAVDITDTLYNSETLQGEPGIRLSFGDKLLLWGAYEGAELRYGGQEVADIDLFSTGLGYSWKWLRFFIGYYFPSTTLRPPATEGLWFEMTKMLSPANEPWPIEAYPYSEYKLHSDFGGEINIRFNHNINDKLSLELIGGYRALRLQEVMLLRQSEEAWLEVFRSKDFGGWKVGFGLIWRF